MTADQARSITNQGLVKSRLFEIYQTIREEAEKSGTSIIVGPLSLEDIRVLKNGGFVVDVWGSRTRISWAKPVSSECDYFTETQKEFLSQSSWLTTGLTNNANGSTVTNTKAEDIEKEYKTVSEDSERVGKTILEWFEELPSGLREKAIRNYDPDFSCVTTYSLSSAIQSAFEWAGTLEGYGFWASINRKLNRGESLTEEYLKLLNV